MALLEKTVIIGIGNPLLTDDGVGVRVAEMIRVRLKDRGDIDVIELYAGGIRLMEAMVGYNAAIIVDAVQTGSVQPGTIHFLKPSGLVATRNSLCVHDINLPTAIEMANLLEIPLPDEINIWGIEAEDVETFSERLTDKVEKAVPVVVEKILDGLL